MNRFNSIITYILKSKKRHGTHSPYVYNLVDKAFFIRMQANHKDVLNVYKKRLSSSKDSISIFDYGAGSKKLGNQRQIKDVFKTSKSGSRYGLFLFQLAEYFKPKQILELGTSLGWGTLMLHLGNEKAQIDTVEGCPETFRYTSLNFPKNTSTINFINSKFDEYIASVNNKIFDLIFIDGDHKGESLLRYVNTLFPFSTNDTIWIIDDIRWSDDMWNAWEYLIQDSRFHVSIDLLRMGMLVRRKEQFKEHFYIRL
jgi:predicted O-methyltransferase YrrM